MERNTILYPSCIKCLPNQVCVTKGNGDDVDPKVNKLVKEDNANVTNEGVYSNQNIVGNDLNKRSKVFQRHKSQKSF